MNYTILRQSYCATSLPSSSFKNCACLVCPVTNISTCYLSYLPFPQCHMFFFSPSWLTLALLTKAASLHLLCYRICLIFQIEYRIQNFLVFISTCTSLRQNILTCVVMYCDTTEHSFKFIMSLHLKWFLTDVYFRWNTLKTEQTIALLLIGKMCLLYF